MTTADCVAAMHKPLSAPPAIRRRSRDLSFADDVMAYILSPKIFLLVQQTLFFNLALDVLLQLCMYK